MNTADPTGASAPGSSPYRAPGHKEGAWAVKEDHREELRRLAPKDWRRISLEGGALAVGSITLTIFSLPTGNSLVIGAICLTAGGLGLAARHRDRDRAEENKDVLSLRDEFGVGPAWTVDLLIRQGEAPTGRDQGLMWVEGGRILFSGLRTSFAITPHQAESPVHHNMAARDLSFRLNLALKAETEVGPVSLSFWPIADGFKRGEDDAASMRYAFNSILEGGRWAVMPEIPGQWPPLEIGPGALHPAQVLRSIRIRAATWAGGAFLLSLPVAAVYPVIGTIEFVVVGGMAVLINWSDFALRRRAYRDAKKAWRGR